MIVVVKAEIFNMDFWMMNKGFKHENVEFTPLENFREIREERKKSHRQTGLVTVDNLDFNDPDEAFEYIFPFLEDYALLLSFAYGYHVFFNNFSFYEKIDDELKFVKSKSPTMRVGKPTGGGPIDLYGIRDFIVATIPLIKNDEFVKKTGIKWALIWYNGANIFSNVTEIKLFSFWVCLEILSNSFVDSNNKEFFPKEKWDLLQNRIRELMENELKFDEEIVNKSINLVGLMRQGSTKERINCLLENYDFEMYIENIKIFNTIRNDISHGRQLNYELEPNPHEEMLKIDRLLSKLILKTLNFYDQRCVHSSIHSENLRALS